MIHDHATCDACNITENARNQAVGLLSRWKRTRDTEALRLDVDAFLDTQPDVLKHELALRDAPTPSEPPTGSTQGVPEARRFMLKLTCCGREADPPSRPMTWAEADAFRESYVSGPGVTSPERPRENGHVRSAIIVEASDVSVLETAAIAGVPEGKPAGDP